MKLKKIVAALCAAAMTVSAVAITPLLSNAAEFGSADGNWAQDVFCNNSSKELAGVDVTGVTSVVFNATANDLNWGWNNGKFTSNSDGGWKDVSFGGNKSDAQVVLDDTGAFKVEIECTPTGGYFELGWGTGSSEGAFTLDSIDFMTADGKLGTWDDGVWTAATVGKPEKPADESFVIWTGSQEMTEDWSQSVSIDASLLANLGAEGKLVMTIEKTAAGAQYAVKNVDWKDLNTNYDLAEGATSFTFDMTEGFANEFKANGFRISGKLYTLTKIEYVGKNGGASKPEIPPKPEKPETPAANPFAGNSTVMPVYSVNLVSSNSAAAIKQLKEGDVYEYQLSATNPVIKRRVFQSIMGKDVTIKVTYKDMTWEFNGKEITEPHTINFKKLYEAAKAE